MKKIFLSCFLVLLGLTMYANNNKYTINDSKVEAALEQSAPIMLEYNSNMMLGVEKVQGDDKNVWVAVALDFFLGGLAVHRVYLGTPPGIIAGYFFTCGGIFGVLPLIDLIVLVINSDDISAYINKKGLIMFN